MASENETVAEIREDVNEYLTSIGPSEYPAETQFEEFADRFVAAHKREVAELREFLKEAVNVICEDCEMTDDFGNLKCKSCKWRKALEGAGNEKE